MAHNSTAAADYQARRDFRHTPEPAFEAAALDAPAAEGTFVVHRHEARRLHYDLRLAAGGVLVSWAVPRGFCYDPVVKHLAVHTEDHPLSYRTFEGVIPKGQYGAGTMLIWDQGSYEVVNAAGRAETDLGVALAAGEVKVILRGRRLRGEWHLVRTNDEQDEWLLFKARDRYARSADEPVPVVDTRARPARLPDRPAAMRPATTTTRFSDPGWLFELEFDGLRTLATVRDGRAVLARPSAAPLELHPRAAGEVASAFSRVRADQALLDGVLVALDARGRPSRSAIDAWVAGPDGGGGGAGAAEGGGSDGSARAGAGGGTGAGGVAGAGDGTEGGAGTADGGSDGSTRAGAGGPGSATDAGGATGADGATDAGGATGADGATDAGVVAGAGGAGATAVYYAFDVLHYDEWDLRAVPLVERKQLLRGLLPATGRLLYVDHVAGSGDQLAATAAAAGFHGLMAKRADGAYRAGEQPGWRRIRLPVDHDAGRLEVHDALARTTRQRRRHTRFPLSNLDKVFWPHEGYTKGDLLHYYEQVAEYLLPYLRERPVHMNRFPDGITGESFFQRQAPAGVPDWVELVEVDAEHDRQFICNDVRTLIYLINLGSIELHPWLSRRGSLDSPDFAVLDLDAKETTFGNAKRVARTAGKVLRGIGLDPALKTSGATGLHIYVPLIPGYGYDQARLFMEAVARVVAREHPDIASVERLPRGRGGKVYVDFLQNRKSATVVPPYAARPVPGASVSMPLDWDELDDDLHPGRFTIKNTPALLARRGDRFRPTLTDRQDFAPAIERLQEYLAGC